MLQHTIGCREIRIIASTCTHTRKNVTTPAGGKNSVSVIVMATQTAISRYWACSTHHEVNGFIPLILTAIYFHPLNYCLSPIFSP